LIIYIKSCLITMFIVIDEFLNMDINKI